jgi:hypothetical protein
MSVTLAASINGSYVGGLVLLFGALGLAWLAVILLARYGSGYWQGFARRMLGAPRQAFPKYGLRDSLLTPGEKPFYAVLREAVGPRFAIMVKVRLEDVLIVPKMERGDEDARSKHWSARGFVKSRHLDFLLCDPATLRPVLAIELDDESHQSQQARHGDDVKNKALQSAGLPLLRVKASGKYLVEEVRGRMGEVMGGPKGKSALGSGDVGRALPL